MEKTLGGDRLGSGKKEKIHLKNYERSTHNLDYVWRSSMSAGTLVPFLCKPALTGSSWDIDLETVVKTLPTIGPLFGSYKVQLDVFLVPIRLYQGLLHMNALGIGMDMKNVKLPVLKMRATNPPIASNIDNFQINSSSIFHYLGIKGLGYRRNSDSSTHNWEVKREFNAIPFLAYYDIYKQYYSNKQEEIGVIIHNNLLANDNVTVSTAILSQSGFTEELIESETAQNLLSLSSIRGDMKFEVTYTTLTDFNSGGWYIGVNGTWVKCDAFFANRLHDETNNKIIWTAPYLTEQGIGYPDFYFGNYRFTTEPEIGDNVEPQLQTFNLTDIDDMRKAILTAVGSSDAFDVNDQSIDAYMYPFTQIGNANSADGAKYSKNSAQEGLLIKTYQSDLFNNWISTEWIDGDGGINEITRVDTSEGYFNIDSLVLSRKVYDLLNRIAVSGGTYDDWLDASYTHERRKGVENPMYMGGLIRELAFEEIFSQSESNGQPLGTLAGKGRMTDKKKGGMVSFKVDEPSYVIGIVSLTPRIDYSQGNNFDVNLKTMDDFHKPAFDQIGFQDLVTDQLAWFDTAIREPYNEFMPPVFKSAGKQPAWINYMTSVNEIHGDFAVQTKEMFMVLNRRYDAEISGINSPLNTPKYQIGDLTTYIDPRKFNFIFANTKLNSMNFWSQIKVGLTVRNKMSAKVMPNL